MPWKSLLPKSGPSLNTGFCFLDMELGLIAADVSCNFRCLRPNPYFFRLTQPRFGRYLVGKLQQVPVGVVQDAKITPQMTPITRRLLQAIALLGLGAEFFHGF